MQAVKNEPVTTPARRRTRTSSPRSTRLPIRRTSAIATSAPGERGRGKPGARDREAAGRDPRHRAYRSAARDAEDVRLRERVSQERLEGGSGEGQRSAHERSEDGARKPELPDDRHRRRVPHPRIAASTWPRSIPTAP